MRKILALVLAAFTAISMTGCIQSGDGANNSIVEEKFETGVRTDGDDLVVNYEENGMQATIRFVYTNDIVSDIKLVFVTDSSSVASATYEDMTSGSSAEEIAELYQDITLDGNKISCRMTDEIIANYGDIDVSKAELAELLANQYGIENFVEADADEEASSADEEATTTEAEEETTTEAEEATTTEAEEESSDAEEFKPSVVIDGENVVCTFEQNGMINVLTYVFVDGTISEINAVFQCESEEIAEASFEMMSEGSVKEQMDEYYKDMQLDGRNITAKFLDEIVEMYEGVTQEEIAELLREQYGVEE